MVGTSVAAMKASVARDAPNRFVSATSRAMPKHAAGDVAERQHAGRTGDTRVGRRLSRGIDGGFGRFNFR